MKLSKMAPPGPIVMVSKSISVVFVGCFIVRLCHDLNESLGWPIISSHFLFAALFETIVTCANYRSKVSFTLFKGSILELHYPKFLVFLLCIGLLAYCIKDQF